MNEPYGDPCTACGHQPMNIPTQADDAHDELCCGTIPCSTTDICVTHEVYPE